MSADAGWYADPADPAWVRYWDGTAWSLEAHPAAAPASTPAPTPSAAPVATPVTTPVVATPTPAVAPAPTPAAAPVPALAPVAPQPVPALEPLAPVRVETRQPVGAGVGASSHGAVPALEPLAPVAVTASVTTPVVAAPAPRVELPRTLPTPAATATATTTVAPAPVVPGPSVSPGFAPDPLGTEPAHGRHPIETTSTLPGAAPWDVAAPVRPGGNGAVGGARFGGGGPVAGPVMRSGASAPIAVAATSSGGGGKVLKRLVITALVLGVLGAAFVFLVQPKLVEMQALSVSAATPSVLPHAAPKALAGQKPMSAPGINPSATASAATQAGSAWAWGASYGKGPERTVYLAADLPAEARADAVHAQTDPAAAERLISTIGSKLAINPAAITNGGPSREYGSTVGGKAWCMPVTLNGNGGGWCVWTNGKELLQVLSFPSVQEMSAKHTLAALTQLAGQVPAAPAAPAKPAKQK